MIFEKFKRNILAFMKLKSHWAIIIPLLFSIIFVACDDKLNDVGGTIQPPSDNISVSLDTLATSARTISMHDSIYARTINGVLGKYQDELFGTVKSDYLAQFFFPDSAKFEKNLTQIDSVQFVIDFVNFSGDSVAPMGLSVYEVNKSLVQDFYTNANPAEFCDLSKTIAKQAYTIVGARKIASSSQRAIIANLDNSFALNLYNAYHKGTITDNESFNNYFKGVYVTTDFGSSSLIDVLYTSIDIYYKYNDVKGNYNNTQDTIRSTRFTLTVTPEVIQLNHIQNTNPSELFVEGTGSTYLKTPAGVYTELDFPLKDIREDMTRLNMNTVTSAQFLVNGNTQAEDNSNSITNRPQNVLLIDKDSISSFFTSRRKIQADGITSFTTARNTSYNTYSFNNVSEMINYYNKKGVDKLTLVLIPVDVSTDTSGSALGIYNYLKPSTAILRSDPSNMKLNLVYNRFNSNND